MTPHDIDNALTLAHTRRHFFRDCGVGVGVDGARARSCRETPRRRIATTRLRRRSRTSPPKAKAVIYPVHGRRAEPTRTLRAEARTATNFTARRCPSRSRRASGSPSSRATPSSSARRASSRKAGQCGMDLSDLLPHHREIVDDVCWLRGMKTDVFNHGPAKCFVNTGSRSSAGRAWVRGLTYGLGSETRQLAGVRGAAIGPARAARRRGAVLDPASCRACIRACRSSRGRARSSISRRRPASTPRSRASSSTR